MTNFYIKPKVTQPKPTFIQDMKKEVNEKKNLRKAILDTVRQNRLKHILSKLKLK